MFGLTERAHNRGLLSNPSITSLASGEVGGGSFCLPTISSVSRYCTVSILFIQGFPGGLEGRASTCNAGDPGSIPELGRSPGEGNGNPLQYSCLENPMDGGAHGVVKSRTRLSDFTSTFHCPS